MPIHDWTRVEAGIFHAFHHRWITAISDVLNQGVLPADYYALPEQYASEFGPDVLTLQGGAPDAQPTPSVNGSHGTGGTGLLLSPPRVQPTAETDLEFYLRKQTPLVIRRVTGDRVVAVLEIVSPGNKASNQKFRAFVEKATELLTRGIHLVILDLFPPSSRDPNGIHAAIWEEVSGQPYTPPAGKPLTVAVYEALNGGVRTYVEPVAVGDTLPDTSLFLAPNGCVILPLAPTYDAAFAAMPRRWRTVLEPTK